MKYGNICWIYSKYTSYLIIPSTYKKCQYDNYFYEVMCIDISQKEGNLQ